MQLQIYYENLILLQKKRINLQTLKTVMRTPNFLDFRLIYTKEALNSAGFNHYILGTGLPTPLTVAQSH